MVKLYNNLFQTDNNPMDDIMKDIIYMTLSNKHSNKIKKIKNTKNG